MIPLPFSLAVLPLALLAAAGYVAASGLGGSRARGGRAIWLAAVVGLPLVTSGPGPVQLAQGLLAGYLGIRAAALADGWRRRARRPPLLTIIAALLSVDELLRPAPAATARRWPRALAFGVGGAAACLALLFIGARLQLWRRSPYLDSLLVCLEVAVGSMGLNNLILAAAAAGGSSGGRSIVGLQDRPALSTSLAEFWAVRWNHLVQPNLERGFFRPWSRRRRPGVGLVATFAASGVMHVIPVLAAGPLAVTLRPALSVMGFFLLHAGLVLVERALGGNRVPASAAGRTRARLRTVILFALLSPLMLGPFAQVCHVHGRTLAQNFSETPTMP